MRAGNAAPSRRQRYRPCLVGRCGLSWDVGPVLGSAPAKLDLTWRYFDLGSVTGGTTAVEGGGDDNPVEALNFDGNTHVVGLGLRIPM